MNYLNQFFTFWQGEGDQWHQRNHDKPSNDKVLEPLLHLQLPRNPTIIEVGCGDGRYIAALQKAFQATAIGLDVSCAAITEARVIHPKVQFFRTGAYAIDLYRADLIVFGFCLYLVDREYLFKVVSRTDKALINGGYIAIHDFDPPEPQIVPYHHKEGVFSYKMDYSQLWLANPQYEEVSYSPTSEDTAMRIIRKGTWDRWHSVQNMKTN